MATFASATVFISGDTRLGNYANCGEIQLSNFACKCSSYFYSFIIYHSLFIIYHLLFFFLLAQDSAILFATSRFSNACPLPSGSRGVVHRRLWPIATMMRGSSALDPPPGVIIHEWDEWDEWDEWCYHSRWWYWEFESYAKLPDGSWASWRWYWEPSPGEVFWTVLRRLTAEAESIPKVGGG